MPARILMLRGVNLGKRRMAMADLRALFEEHGYGGVRTYVQSGNVVLDAEAGPDQLAADAQRLISERFGFDVPVVVRTRDELAAVVAHDPLGEQVTEPKRYQVSFLAAELPPETLAALQAQAQDSERLAVHGREIYTWHPDGVARSKLAAALADKRVGVLLTARNWRTVTTLLAMADELEG